LLQLVITGEQGLLQHAIDQLKRIPQKEQRGSQERSHLKSLLSRVETEKGVVELTFLQSFLLPSQKWADKRLGDYHQNFTEVFLTFFRVKYSIYGRLRGLIQKISSRSFDLQLYCV
jgi:hypothetical protein